MQRRRHRSGLEMRLTEAQNEIQRLHSLVTDAVPDTAPDTVIDVDVPDVDHDAIPDMIPKAVPDEVSDTAPARRHIASARGSSKKSFECSVGCAAQLWASRLQDDEAIDPESENSDGESGCEATRRGKGRGDGRSMAEQDALILYDDDSMAEPGTQNGKANALISYDDDDVAEPGTQNAIPDNTSDTVSDRESDEEYEDTVNGFIEAYMDKHGVVTALTDERIRSFLNFLENLRSNDHLTDAAAQEILNDIYEVGFETAVQHANSNRLTLASASSI